LQICRGEYVFYVTKVQTDDSLAKKKHPQTRQVTKQTPPTQTQSCRVLSEGGRNPKISLFEGFRSVKALNPHLGRVENAVHHSATAPSGDKTAYGDDFGKLDSI
jgi:hypothetical protein